MKMLEEKKGEALVIVNIGCAKKIMRTACTPIYLKDASRVMH